jgi:hypothetical protein
MHSLSHTLLSAPLSRADVAKRLGIATMAPRTQTAHIRTLIITRGFPAPLNFRIVGGQVLQGAVAVHARSRWDAIAVAAWFDTGLTPAMRVARDTAARDNARHALATSASALFDRIAA